MIALREWTVEQVNETEVDIRIRGYLEWRLVLLNRTQDIREFCLARPGIGGNFETNYRWATHFDIVSRKIETMIANSIMRLVPAHDFIDNLDAIMEARRMLIKSNRAYLPRTRA